MFLPQVQRLALAIAFGIGTAAVLGAPAMQDPPPPGLDDDVPQQQGVEILASGPVHEGFAGPVVYDPESGLVVPKQPPENIEELPPDQKPEGENAVWVPGYWAWDEERNDFLWVSGIWRIPPPGRQWVPGYWNQLQGGWQWVSGTWMPMEVASGPEAEVQYLPQPPATLEAGPNVPAPAADHLWVPGCWVWQQRYVWRPGFWTPAVTNWVWIPAHYVVTPGGWLFVPGCWDYVVAQRGLLFAPVYYTQPVYTQPNYVYTPPVVVNPLLMMQSLFIQPNRGGYFFGDYYGPAYAQRGYLPWYSLQSQRRGYDPMFNYLSATTFRNNPRWVDNVDRLYAYRRENAGARPPRTFADVRRINRERRVEVKNIENIRNIENVLNVENVNNTTLVQSLKSVGDDKSDHRVRLERIDRNRQQELAQQNRAVREMRQQRAQAEKRAAAVPERQRPRTVELPRSPIVARENANQRPPERPRVPRIDENARPAARRGEVTKRNAQAQPKGDGRREVMRPGPPNNNRTNESHKSTPSTRNNPQRKSNDETQQRRKAEAEAQQKRKAAADVQQRRKATDDGQARRKAVEDAQRHREAARRKAGAQQPNPGRGDQRKANRPNRGNNDRPNAGSPNRNPENRPKAEGSDRGNGNRPDGRPGQDSDGRGKRENPNRGSQPKGQDDAKGKGQEKQKG